MLHLKCVNNKKVKLKNVENKCRKKKSSEQKKGKLRTEKVGGKRLFVVVLQKD